MNISVFENHLMIALNVSVFGEHIEFVAHKANKAQKRWLLSFVIYGESNSCKFEIINRPQSELLDKTAVYLAADIRMVDTIQRRISHLLEQDRLPLEDRSMICKALRPCGKTLCVPCSHTHYKVNQG